MQRTTPRLRVDSASRLAKLQRERPEWQAWLTLLAEAERAGDYASWHIPLDDGLPEATPAGDTKKAPLLHGRILKVDAGRLQQLIHRLGSMAASPSLSGAESLQGYRPSCGDSVRLLSAAVRQDSAEIGALADAARVDRGALTSIAHLSAFPLLQSAGRLLQDRIPPSWTDGYCPICGAWPILTERRGLDRSRRLRCGRCAAEWQVPWLSCIYCGERDHEHLGSLVPEELGERLNVETCSSCRGYLKSVATLQAIPPFELPLQDLETVELDLVALERGYGRPEQCGFILEIHLA